MLLEQILSAAVAAVDAHELEIEAIPSPDVRFPTISAKKGKNSNGDNNEINRPHDVLDLIRDKTETQSENSYVNEEVYISNEVDIESDMKIPMGEEVELYGHEESSFENEDTKSECSELQSPTTSNEAKGLDMPMLLVDSDNNCTLETLDNTTGGLIKKPTLRDKNFIVQKNHVGEVVCNGKPDSDHLTDLNENIQEPVEVSFFSLDDENLVITSEQALKMFETNEIRNLACYDNCRLIKSDAESRSLPVKKIPKRRSEVCHMQGSHTILNIEQEHIIETPTSERRSMSEGNVQYDFIEVPDVSNTEEVDFTEVEVVDESEYLPRVSSEIEVLTTEETVESPQYTVLTPPNSEDGMTSTAVSEALQTLVGDSLFDIPPGASVDTTVDGNGQFVVQVMGPGMSMTIPNNHYNPNSSINHDNSGLQDLNGIDMSKSMNFQMPDNYNILREEKSHYQNQINRCNDVPESSTITENDYQHSSMEQSKGFRRKRQWAETNEENSKEENHKKQKKVHSSVIAALRESIFRSKARKIVYQLEKEPEINNEVKSRTESEIRSKEDETQKTRDGTKTDENKEKVFQQFEEENDSLHYQSNDYDFSEKDRCNPNFHKEYPQTNPKYTYPDAYVPHPEEYPPHRPEHNFVSKGDLHPKNHSRYNRHHSPSRDFDYRRYDRERCHNKCCSTSSSSSRGYRRDPEYSSPRNRDTSPCRRCGPKDSQHPFMMLRPEDLPSMLKGNMGKDGTPPLVMMQPDSLKNTDGDPLKVQLVYLVYPMEGRRMSVGTMHQHRHSRDMPKSPSCGNSCSPNRYDQYPSSPHMGSSSSQSLPSPTARKKDVSWLNREHHQQHIDNEIHKQSQRAPSPPPVSNSEHKRDDPEGYLRKPIEEWSYADVIFFLMEACKELRINPGDVKFKNTDNGSLLLCMSPSDFEVLAPNHGQKLHDYFINFKTQHYMVSESHHMRSPYDYNGQRSSHSSDSNRGYSPQDDPHHHSHHSNGSIFPHSSSYQHDQCHNEHRRYPQYLGSPGHSSYHPSYIADSPSQEYVPQGSQYRGDNPHHQDIPQRKFPDLPSAAGKSFPPLHNHDEPLSDPDECDEDLAPEPPKKRGPGRPPKPENERKRKAKKTGRLWEFIRNLLLDPKTCPSLLRWEDPQEGVFRIVQSDAIANKWGMRKNNEKMNYEKLSRAMRYYYKAKIFEPVLGKRLVYKFGSNAKGWRPLNPDNPNFQNNY